MQLKLNETKNSNKHSFPNNLNRREADQLAINKHDQGVKRGSTEKQLQLSERAALEPATFGIQVRRPNHSATLPPQEKDPCGTRVILNLFQTRILIRSLIPWLLLFSVTWLLCHYFFYRFFF